MHMIIEKEKGLSLSHSPYITPYSIKSTDNEKLHTDDLEKIVASVGELQPFPVIKNCSNIVLVAIKMIV